jgi:hypothetical protein
VEMLREDGFHSLIVAFLRLLKNQGKGVLARRCFSIVGLVGRYLSSRRKRVFEHISRFFRASLADSAAKTSGSYQPSVFSLSSATATVTLLFLSPPKWQYR